MPDHMDAIQDRVQRETDAIIANHTAPAAAGRTTCARAECGEPIAPQRTAIGARLCIDCQHEEEARQAHFRTWGAR